MTMVIRPWSYGGELPWCKHRVFCSCERFWKQFSSNVIVHTRFLPSHIGAYTCSSWWVANTWEWLHAGTLISPLRNNGYIKEQGRPWGWWSSQSCGWRPRSSGEDATTFLQMLLQKRVILIIMNLMGATTSSQGWWFVMVVDTYVRELSSSRELLLCVSAVRGFHLNYWPGHTLLLSWLGSPVLVPLAKFFLAWEGRIIANETRTSFPHQNC